MNKKIIFITLLLVIVCFSFTFVACNKVNDLLAPSNIKYDGQYVTWDKCEAASYYNVSINGGDSQRVNGTTFQYVSSESFEVTVAAVYGDSGEATATQTFKPLATISALYTNDDGSLMWDAIAGANAYSISVNGIVVGDVTDTSYTKLNVGANTVKVKPIVSGDATYYSAWSNEKQIYINATPSNLKYDGATLSWTGNAQSYEVKINGQVNTVTKAQFDYNSQNLDFDVEIKGIGNHTSTFDSAVKTDSFHYLDAVTEINVVDGILTWNEIDNAVGYKIKAGSVTNTVVGETKYDNITAGKSIDFSILPYNDTGNYFSSWSATKTVYLLNTPVPTWNADLELDGDANNNYVWDAINGAEGYTVVLEKDGQSQTVVLTADHRTYANAYDEVGTYTLKVKANAPIGDSNYYDSKFSTIMTIERLAAPAAAASNFITSDPDDASKGFTVNYQTVNGAKGYQLYKDGVLVEGKYSTSAAITDNSAADTLLASEQHYTYIIRSIGDVKTTNGKTTVRLSSLTASSLSFDITVQAIPTDLLMDGYYAKWSNVDGNNGYCLSYSGTTITAQEELVDLSTIVAGTYEVKVCTRGNGLATLASNYTAPINLTRLSAPTEIMILGSEANGLLSYKSVEYATGYSVFLDLSTTALDETAYTNMNDYITEQGSVLSMRADANKYNEENTVYYMSSPISQTYQFIRLAAPVFPEGALSSQTELVWDACANINSAEYTPTYAVYEADEQCGTVNATKYSISQLASGNYTFKVKAIGNNTQYIDSKESLTISFQKLATPTLTVDSDGYHWESIPNASSYVLTIDGVKVEDDIHTALTTYTYMPHYTSIGTHTVKLYAVGDGRTTVNSNTAEYSQVVETFLAPSISYAYSSDSFVKNGELSVTVTTPTPNAKNYLYEIAGKSIVTDELSASQVIENTGEFTMWVKALGDVIDSDEVYYLDSKPTTTYTIYMLSVPNLAGFSINKDGVIKWSTVSNANGYDYCLAYDGGEYSEVTHTGYASLNPISDYKSYTSITIKVRASSNSATNKVNSEWVEWTWTNNL